MLENINILECYDETQKNKEQMSLFLDLVADQLYGLESEKGISVDDYYALSDWMYVLEHIYKNYRDIVSDKKLFGCIGVCHMLNKRSAIDSMLDGDEND